MKKVSKFKFLGFTLIELLAGLTLVLIVSAVVAPNFLGSLRKGKDKSLQVRAQLLDAAKVSFINAEGKQQALAKWADAHAKEGYDASDIASNNPATTVDSKATNPNVPTKASLRDEAKYQLLLPYLENCAATLGYGAQNGEYAPFGYWFHLNGLMSDASNVTYTPPDSSKTFTLTVNSSDPNKGSVTGTGSYKYNQPATVTATAKTGYAFINWTINDGSPSPFDVNVAYNNFPMAGNVTLTANFDVDESLYHSFTVTAGAGGTASYSADSSNPASYKGKWKSGSKFTIVATPNANQIFTNWTSTGGNPADAAAATTTFTMGDVDATANANFAHAGYTFTVTAGTGGTATYTPDPSNQPMHDGKWVAGSKFTITATPNAGGFFIDWTGGNGGTFADTKAATTTFTLGAQDTVVTANFKTLPTRVTGSFYVGSGSSLALNEDGSELYIGFDSEYGPGRRGGVAVYSTKTRTLIRDYNFGSRVLGLDYHAGYLYAARYRQGDIVRFNAKTGGEFGTIIRLSFPCGLDINKAGNVIYATSFTGPMLNRFNLVNNGSSWQHVATASSGARGVCMALSTNEQYVWGACNPIAMMTPDLGIIRTRGGSTGSIAASPVSRELYVVDFSRSTPVHVYDQTTFDYIRSIPTGVGCQSGVDALAVDPSGSPIYMATQFSGYVYILE